MEPGGPRQLRVAGPNAHGHGAGQPPGLYQDSKLSATIQTKLQIDFLNCIPKIIINLWRHTPNRSDVARRLEEISRGGTSLPLLIRLHKGISLSGEDREGEG